MKKREILNLKRNACLLVCLLSFSYNVSAKISKKSIKVTKKKTSKSNFKASLEGTSNQMVENVGEVVGNKYFADLEMSYNSNPSNGAKKKFKMASRFNNESQLMFSVEEAKLTYNFKSSDIIVGRNIIDWSKTDENWSLGKVNNRRNFDGFKPGQEGLTGFFFNYRGSNGFRVSTFASVLYIPETNPGVKIDKENGRVSCQNPWCKAPSESAPIDENTNVPIYYNINYPEITNVVFRYSLGAKIGYESDTFSVEGYALKKPENQVSVSAEVRYEIDNNRVFADITPQFYYHNVYGLDVKMKPSKNWLLYGSAIGIHPDSYPDGSQPYIEYTGIKPEKIKEEYVGAGAIYKTRFFSLGGHYIARISEFDKKDNILATYPRWSQAAHMNLKTQLTGKFAVEVDLKYDMLTEDRLSMLKATYSVNPRLSTSVGANIIGTSSDESYWADFSNNDSLYGSLKYIF